MRVFLITPYGEGYEQAERVVDDLLNLASADEDIAVYNPAGYYAFPGAPTERHLLLRETLPRLLDADAVLYLPGWMGDKMALLYACIAQELNMAQWIPQEPLPIVTDEVVVVLEENESEHDLDWVLHEPVPSDRVIAASANYSAHRDSGDEQPEENK